MKIIYTDVLVIGGGLAGLRVAIGARRRGHDSIVLSLVATLYPSWRASRVKPAEALRYD